MGQQKYQILNKNYTDLSSEVKTHSKENDSLREQLKSQFSAKKNSTRSLVKAQQEYASFAYD